MRRELVGVIVAVTAGTWFVMSLPFGLPDNWWAAARPFLTALTTAGAVLIFYDKLGWRAKIFHGWLTHQPNLRGVWRVEIKSTWVDPKTDEKIAPKKGFVQIDQTSSTFCMRIFTDQSKSKTIAYSFEMDRGVYRLGVVYENEPEIALRITTSPMHKGSSVFDVRGYRPVEISGDYWTDRETSGTIILTEPTNGEIDSYAGGMRHYGLALPDS